MAGGDGGGLVVHSGGDPVADTVRVVLDHLERGVAPNEVAVLARVNVALAPVQVALIGRHVPVQPTVDLSFMARSGVQAALAWLHLSTAPAGRLAGADLALAARRPSRAMSPRVVTWLAEQKSTAALGRLANRLTGRDGDKVLAFVADLDLVRRRATSGTTVQILETVRDDLGLDRAMELLDQSRRRLDRSAQTDDLDALVALAGLHLDPNGFDEWLRASLAPRPTGDGVLLSTIHRVKGREWPHVVLHHVSAGLVPHRLAFDLEEERRVLHVGLTRAVSSLHLVAGEHPSPFLTELTEPFRPGQPQARRFGPIAGRAGPSPVRDGRSSVGAGDVADPVADPVAEAVADRARQALRAWRTAQAARQGKPFFVILHDRTVEALATEMPDTMERLARVRGIGPAKLDAYGDELLALLDEVRRA